MPLTSLLRDLPATPASVLKQKGWRTIVRELAPTGRLVVTNHKEPEAIILSLERYQELVQKAEGASHTAIDPLEALRRRFNKRLGSLNGRDASDQLRTLMQRPGSLKGASVTTPSVRDA